MSITRHWGQNQREYLTNLRQLMVKVAFIDGKTLKGRLTGVDTFEIFVQVGKVEVLIKKGAIKYMHPISEERKQDERYD